MRPSKIDKVFHGNNLCIIGLTAISGRVGGGIPRSWGPSSATRETIFREFVTSDIPQSEIAATNFYDRAKSWAKSWAKNFGRTFLGIFVLHLLCRATHQNFSPNSSQFITPCLVRTPVAEFSKFHLRELLGLGASKICI